MADTKKEAPDQRPYSLDLFVDKLTQQSYDRRVYITVRQSLFRAE